MEQPSISTRKKVTFDSNVKTYEPVVVDEVTEFPGEKSEDCGKKEEEALAKPSESKSSSDTGSVTSTCSYPPNSRYQNCRESDDEDEEVIGYGESDLSDEDDLLHDDSDIGEDYEEDDDEDIAYSRARTCAVQITNAEQEVESPIPSGTNANLNVRDRSVYVHPVLNPVENLTQWKALKSKGKRTPVAAPPSLMPQKENCISEPSFKERCLSSKAKKQQEIAVDASLSNWLGSSIVGTPERSPSQGSNSVISHEDRPILGALTVDEIKQFSASNSPRKSPSKSPDEMPIIGTVGTYWNHSASSFKGIPNTTSKYREVKLEISKVK